MKPTGKIEQDYVVSLGWIDEGIAWRVERGHPDRQVKKA